MIQRRKSITELARELRINQTPGEKLLWDQIRKRRLNGYRFIRQKPFIYKQENRRKCFFIADFNCPEKKLVLELDGEIRKYKQYFDYQRDLVLQRLGLKTLRIRNEELQEMQKVLKVIVLKLESL